MRTGRGKWGKVSIVKRLPKNPHFPYALTVVATAALSCAWLAEVVFGAASGPVKLGLMALALGASVSAVGLWSRAEDRVRSTALRFVDTVFFPDQCDGAERIQAEVLDQLGAHSPWRDTLLRLRQFVTTCHAECAQAEQALARVQVRAQRLAAERQQLSEILSALADPVLAVNPYDELVVANERARELFQIDLEDQAEPPRRMDQTVDCPEMIQLFREIRRRTSPTQRTGEVELTDPQGVRRAFHVTVRSLAVADGAGLVPSAQPGAVAVLRDVSGQKAVQQRNAEFVSAVSHEMKTPLSGIKAYVELLADGTAEDEETREEFLGVINSQAERLQRLIDNMLNLARIEAGVVEVSKQSCSLNEILDEARSVIQPAAEEKQLRLVSDLSQLFLGVLADRDMILQVAINLLSNAVKYTCAGGTITLRSRTKDSDVQFEVADSGVGLSPEECARVFDKFYRVKKDEHMARGTGLGLPLARHIVEDVHGGTLTVESQPGKGSTFIVTLPALGHAR